MMDGMKVLMSLRSSARQASGLRTRRGASVSRSAPIRPRPLRIYTRRNFEQIRQLRCLSEEQRFAIRVVTRVLPFRVNQYVIDRLIKWQDVPNDPMFRLVFPQPEMLAPAILKMWIPEMPRGRAIAPPMR